jgi:hypothetical protein
MPVAWFFAPGVRKDTRIGPTRSNLIAANYTAALSADGGEWHAVEAYGDYFAVKVRCNTAATLQTIAADPQIVRVPLAALNDPTSSLSAAQRSAIVNLLTSMGFTSEEINAQFPDGWDGAYTVRQIVKFAVHKRLTPRYDSASDQIVLDGAEVQQDGSQVDFADASLQLHAG